jgi:hypothetical protein
LSPPEERLPLFQMPEIYRVRPVFPQDSQDLLAPIWPGLCGKIPKPLRQSIPAKSSCAFSSSLPPL